MAQEIKMPQLSDTMHEGKILGWRKKEGDSVSRGEVLAEVETDKANLEIEAFVQGTVLKVLVPAGQVARVGEPIAVVGAPGEVFVGSNAASSAVSQQTAATTANVPSAPLVSGGISISPAKMPTPQAATIPASNGDRIKASPLARKMAEQAALDLRGVHGSGPSGRIVKKDVEAAAASRQSSAAEISASFAKVERAIADQEPSRAAAPGIPVGAGSITPLSRMRETIARRMQESIRETPHFYTTVAVDMREAMRLREILKERADFKGISVNHLIIKAVGYALTQEPRVNCALRDGMLYTPAAINIGIITAVEDGLLIPVIQNVPALPLKDIVFEARAAIERARAGRPNSSDLTGGTFSISNMGMFDVENFTAIINPGQGAVLAVSAVKEEPLVDHSQIVVGLRMRATLSVDHRIIDGIMAAQFMKHFKQALEVPALLMI